MLGPLSGASQRGLSAGLDGLYFTGLYRDSGSNATATGANLLRIRWVGANLGECGSIVQSYCGPVVPNSFGFPATIRARGSDHVADNDVLLDVDQLPPNSFGYCLGSKTWDIQIFVTSNFTDGVSVTFR